MGNSSQLIVKDYIVPTETTIESENQTKSLAELMEEFKSLEKIVNEEEIKKLYMQEPKPTDEEE